jgi:hypothetical protein
MSPLQRSNGQCSYGNNRCLMGHLHTKHSEIFNVKTVDTYSYRCALRGQTKTVDQFLSCEL